MKLILPGYLTVLLLFLSINLNAADTNEKTKNRVGYVIAIETNDNICITRKGFIKRTVQKIKAGTKKVYRKTINKFKRIASKRHAKKDRMKSGFKDRKRNLFNILIFSLVFFALAALIVFLGLSVGLYLMYILGIILIISAIVIALIYFSGRYILKPRIRS